MKKFSIAAFSFSVLAVFFFATSYALAQVSPGVSADDVSVTLSPQFPGPHQQVSVSIDSYALDLNSSDITWLVNGKQVSKGQGIKSINITTGNSGSQTAVSITIDNSAVTLQKSLTITPNAVNIIWQAYTYTPPFFKGKALYTAGSAVEFIADPQFSGAGNPANFVYTWTYNGTVLSDASGAGKNTVTIPGQLIPRPLSMVIDVSDPISGASGEGTISLNSVNSEVLLYQNDPLYGIEYDHALGQNTTLTGQELDLTAVPYYFSVQRPTDNSLTYAWTINGQSITGSTPDQAFRRSGASTGASDIGLSVTDPNTLFQAGSVGTVVNFSNSTAAQTTF